MIRIVDTFRGMRIPCLVLAAPCGVSIAKRSDRGEPKLLIAEEMCRLRGVRSRPAVGRLLWEVDARCAGLTMPYRRGNKAASPRTIPA